VADIPPKYGMLLSRSWGSKLGGSLQLDITYATILVFGGQFTRLYRETKLDYIVSDPQHPHNYPVYGADQDLGNCILSVNSGFETCTKFEQFIENKEHEEIEQGIWEMCFDGASSLKGAWVGIMFISPLGTKENCFSYRLEFEIDASNNVCEYEALVIGL
jgi:hypothetical protein